MIKFYGTMICPKCQEAKKILDEQNLWNNYEYIDITETTANMKEFLKLRDTRKEFEPIKEEGRIGIPCFYNEKEDISFEL